MPMLFRFLPRQQLGLWFLIGTSGAFVSLMGLGFSDTFRRFVAFAKGKTSSDPDADLSESSCQEVADVLATGKVFYRFLSLVVFVLALATGFYFLGALDLSPDAKRVAWIAWTIMCAGHAINVWGGFLTFLVTGMGDVGHANLLDMVLSMLRFLATVGVVLWGGGLVALATVQCAMGGISRLILWGYAHWRYPQILQLRGAVRFGVLHPMIRPATRIWLVGLGAFLVLKTDDYFIAWFSGASDVPDYRGAYTMVLNIYAGAVAIAMVSKVFISQAFRAGDWPMVHRLVFRCARIGFGLMVAGVAVVITIGDSILSTWLGEGHFVGWPVLLTFCLMLALECQHVTLASACISTNDIPFGPCAIGAGLLNILFTILLIRSLGLWGVALGTLFAQLMTSNWYCVWRSLKRLRISFGLYVQRVILPIGAQFIIALVGCYTIRRLTTVSWSSILGCFVWSGLIYAAMLWFGVVDSNQGARISNIYLGSWQRTIRRLFSPSSISRGESEI